jgi:trehalose 6-phosphate synthase
VFAELGEACVPVHPFDIVGTADALHDALTMPADRRRALHDAGLHAVTARTAAHWLRDQLSSV